MGVGYKTICKKIIDSVNALKAHNISFQRNYVLLQQAITPAAFLQHI